MKFIINKNIFENKIKEYSGTKYCKMNNKTINQIKNGESINLITIIKIARKLEINLYNLIQK